MQKQRGIQKSKEKNLSGSTSQPEIADDKGPKVKVASNKL